MRIRRARPRDADVLTRIAHAAKRHWGYPEGLMHVWKDDLTVTPAFIRRHPVYCTVSGGVVVGFYALSRVGASFELEHFWVAPGHMGLGLGSALFDHALAAVRGAGGGVLRIASDPHATGFYERQGAVRTGEVPSRPPGRMLPLLEVHLAPTTPPGPAQ